MLIIGRVDEENQPRFSRMMKWILDPDFYDIENNNIAEENDEYDYWIH